VFAYDHLDESPDIATCAELPDASLYQPAVRFKEFTSLTRACVPNPSHFICSFGRGFGSNPRKEMHI
jgi:hypothetical protein